MSVCRAEGCDRTDHVGRGLCGRCYQAAWKADRLPAPLPKDPPPPHTCDRHEPSSTCYVGCGCRCQGCRDCRAAAARRRTREKAYGTYEGYADAEPVRQHVRDLMAPKVGSGRGMGWKRIARKAGVASGVMTKLLYGDPTRGMPPSRRIKKANADALLAVHEDLADGAQVPAGPTRRRLAEMVDGGFSKAELGRYLTGDVRTRSLQVGDTRTVTVAHDRQVRDLHRRWKAGEVVPRGRRSRWEHGPASPFPATTPRGLAGVTVLRERCEDCGAPSLAGGLWCLTHFQQYARQQQRNAS